MGKLKRSSRSSRHRKNPIKRVGNGEEDAVSRQDENLTRTKIMPLIKQLTSTASNDRSMALGAISVLAEDVKFRKLLLKEKLLQIVLEQCLSDSDSEIIVESFGLLRNFVIEEGYDVAVYLWRQGIWTTIEANFGKAKVSFDEFKAGKVTKVQTGLVFDYVENLISLVTGLADSSDDIFEHIQTKIEPIMTFIKEILQFSIDGKTLKINVNLFNAILDFIYDFSSQSESFIQDLSSKYDLNFDSLYTIIDEIPRFNELSKVYVQGIKLQLLESSITAKDVTSIVTTIINTISKINIEDIRKTLTASIDNTKPEDLNKDAKVRVEARSKLQAIELSLEIITAISEIIASTKLEIDEELVTILTTNIPTVLLTLLPYEEFRTRTLTSLNNLSWLFITIDLVVDAWTTTTLSIWNAVLSLSDYELEEKISVFGILWAILIVNLEQVPITDEFVGNTIQELKSLVLENGDIEAELKEEYLTRLVGVLGTLAKKQGFVERNFIVSSTLLELVETAQPSIPSSVLTVEVLDILYEVYGDASFDYDEPVFVEKKYLEKLEQLTPKIKAAVKLIDRKTQPGLKEKADEVFRNLGRFIQYKKTERN